jgi:hypothetical protein
MYDLTWSRSRVDEMLMLCTRAQLTKREFDEIQDVFHVKARVSFEESLTYCLAASQGCLEAGRLWNRLKRVMHRPPTRAKPDERDLVDLYLFGIRKGKTWTQRALFEGHVNALSHLG